MSRVTRHYRLPVASTDSISDPKLFKEGRTVTLYFDYLIDNEPRRSGIRFDGVVCLRTSNERFSSSWNVKAFDTLTEIHDSEWPAQIKREIHERHHSELSGFRHFAVYLDSTGSFEVLSTDFEILPEESGSWESLRTTSAI